MHNPTVRPAVNFDADADAAALRKAMKGLGTDEDAIIEILANRSNEQRQIIARQFKSNYGEDLIDWLKSEISGNFEKTVLAMMTPKIEYYARELNGAVAGLGTTETTLIEILCSVSNKEVDAILDSYKSIYNRPLEDDVIDDTSGQFKRILVSICTENCDESTHVNRQMVIRDAEQLNEPRGESAGSEEIELNKIFTTRSFAHLKNMFEVYEQKYGRSIRTFVEEEFSGSTQKALLAIVKMAQDLHEFFAEQLHDSMKGLGTSDSRLIRLIVTRSEKDLGNIKIAFERLYGGTLESWIEDDCSGDYKKCLLALCA